jgi:hypothetical protein
VCQEADDRSTYPLRGIGTNASLVVALRIRTTKCTVSSKALGGKREAGVNSGELGEVTKVYGIFWDQ